MPGPSCGVREHVSGEDMIVQMTKHNTVKDRLALDGEGMSLLFLYSLVRT